MNKLSGPFSSLLKKGYVRFVRLVRPVFRSLGILRYLEQRPTRRAKWFRSLFAIYDLDDLVSLNLPWWSFEAVDEVEGFLSGRSAARVFEWGSGASTIWLSRLADEVISVEHDTDFGVQVKDRIGSDNRVTLRVIPPAAEGLVTSSKLGFEGLYFDKYVAEIENTEGQFDVVVIDGRAREACLATIGDKLKSDGIIVFDDTERTRYSDAIKGSSYVAKPMPGLAVCLPMPRETTILRRAPEN